MPLKRSSVTLSISGTYDREGQRVSVYRCTTRSHGACTGECVQV